MGSAVSVHSVLSQGRRFIDTLMTETVAIGTLTSEPGPNFETVESIGTPVYSGIARLKWSSTTVSDASAAGQSASVQSVVLKLPVGTSGVHEGMYAIVSASSVDPGLVGRRFRIAGQPESGQVTALRFPVEEESS